MIVYEIGQRASLSRVFTEEDLAAYAALTGAAAGREVPRAMIGGLFSKLLGVDLPGRGTNWMKQSLVFERPARVGERLTATVEIVRLRPEKDLVNLRTTCRTASGDVVADGEALVMAREMAGELA